MVLGLAARVVLGSHEVRLDSIPVPAGSAAGGPLLIVERMAADVEHRVHRAGATQAFAAWHIDGTAVAVGLGLGAEIPVALGFELLGEGSWDLHVGMAIAATCLDQEHLDAGVFAEAVGEHAPRRTGADDHIVRHWGGPRSGRR